jgi:hypothetical protein
MSTLKVTNILSNSAGFNDVVSFKNSGGTENGKLCRAFVNFSGTGAVAIRASFNVSSITDNGSGDYTVNFTNAMIDANYSASGLASNNDNNDDESYVVGVQASNAFTSSGIRIRTVENSSNVTLRMDTVFICVVIFR